MPPAFLDGWMDGWVCVCVLSFLSEKANSQNSGKHSTFIHSEAIILTMIFFSHFRSHPLKKSRLYQRFDIMTFEADNKIECSVMASK